MRMINSEISVENLVRIWNKNKYTLIELTIISLILRNKKKAFNVLTKNGKVTESLLELLKKNKLIVNYDKNGFPILSVKAVNLFSKYIEIKKKNVDKPITVQQLKISKKVNYKKIANTIHKVYPTYRKNVSNKRGTTLLLVSVPYLEKRLKLLIRKYPDQEEVLANSTIDDIKEAVKSYCGVSGKVEKVNDMIKTASNFIYDPDKDESKLITLLEIISSKKGTQQTIPYGQKMIK